eukprot:5737308-Pyramimonas_sp.AAC.1
MSGGVECKHRAEHVLRQRADDPKLDSAEVGRLVRECERDDPLYGYAPVLECASALRTARLLGVPVDGSVAMGPQRAALVASV